MVGRTGHRPTLRQVPEVYNLLRHLNINEKFRKYCRPNLTMAMEERLSPWGDWRRL